MAFSPMFGQRIRYGADYNPEQWLQMPGIIDADLEMMRQVHLNTVSMAMFSWAKLEPEEGHYDLAWLDRMLDRLEQNGIGVFLSTPSGAKPNWLAQKYPEVRRVNARGEREWQGERHNHCYTSPVYREKTAKIDELLAGRYAHHPAVIGWHLSNEYGGACYCDYCRKAFRLFLLQKYGSLDNLNQAWWTAFWSHTYTAWDQIEPPSPVGEHSTHGLKLDWQRFCSRQAQSFCKMEYDQVKAANPQLPVTTNFMEYFRDYDYYEWARDLDFVSWDSYPRWQMDEDEIDTAAYTAMYHDYMRSLKGGRPFVLMESTPSMTNWREFSALKRPGENILSSLQALAHGADSIQYFQWRKSRGSSEKFHGAVVDHVGHINTRVGREAKALGEILERCAPIAGSAVEARAALVFDTHNRWALEDAQGPRNTGMGYIKELVSFYRRLWQRGIAVDVIDETCDLSQYQLVIAPLTYMLRGSYAARVGQFVQAGGTYVSTYWSGIVNESDLCFLGGFPGPLRSVLGIWDEEIDSLRPGRTVRVEVRDSPWLKRGSYTAAELVSLCHAEGAEVLAVFAGDDFYQDSPALTVNRYGSGEAYYIAGRMAAAF